MNFIWDFLERYHWTETLARKGLKIIVIGLVVFLSIKAIHWACNAVMKISNKRRTDTTQSLERDKRLKTLVKLVDTTFTVLLFGAAFLMILRECGLDITPLLTGAGIAGVAVGFGAQSLVKDMISGFFILVDDQIRVSDVVKLNGVTGTVESVDLRTTSIRDAEGILNIIPNGEIKMVSNMTYEFSVAVVNVYFPYKTDVLQAVQKLKDVVKSVEDDPVWKLKIYDAPKVLAITEFTHQYYVAQVTIKTEPHWRAKLSHELRRRIQERIPGMGIELS